MVKKKTAKKSEIVFTPRVKYDFTPDEKIVYDCIVVGAGVVGYSAAMYSGRLGLKTLVIGEMPGGTITLTHIVENYPGFVSLTGMQLAKALEQHAKDYDIDILSGRVDKISKVKDNFLIATRKQVFMGKTIIYATGSKWKKLGVKGEKEYENRGVSYCALCDGPLFRNKIVGVVGGADSAVKEALLLSEFTKKVFVIYRGDKLHPEPVNMKRLETKVKKGKIEIISNTNIVEIVGDGKQLTKVVFDKLYKGKKDFNLQGLFIEIGHEPLSDLAKQIGVKTNVKSEILINRNSETNVSGFFAAGDVSDTEFKQAITGVGEAVHAAYRAYVYLKKEEL